MESHENQEPEVHREVYEQGNLDFHLLRTRGCLLLNMKPYIAKAGVRGQIVGLVGSFYECGKKGKPKSHIKIYELQIDELFKKWPDKKRRERRWVHT